MFSGVVATGGSCSTPMRRGTGRVGLQLLEHLVGGPVSRGCTSRSISRSAGIEEMGAAGAGEGSAISLMFELTWAATSWTRQPVQPLGQGPFAVAQTLEHPQRVIDADLYSGERFLRHGTPPSVRSWMTLVALRVTLIRSPAGEGGGLRSSVRGSVGLVGHRARRDACRPVLWAELGTPRSGG